MNGARSFAERAASRGECAEYRRAVAVVGSVVMVVVVVGEVSSTRPSANDCPDTRRRAGPLGVRPSLSYIFVASILAPRQLFPCII